MKLNLTPKEMLALYNLLYEQQGQIKCKYEPGVDPIPDHVYLDQLFSRVRSVIVASIGRQSDDPADAKKVTMEQALAHEQAKIDKLKVDLVDVDKERAKLVSAAKRGGDFLVPDGDEDLVVPEYPTRPRRAHGGGGHGRKK